MIRQPTGLKKIRAFVLAKTGILVDQTELNQAFGKSRWMSVVRYIRDYEGLDIELLPAGKTAEIQSLLLKSSIPKSYFSARIASHDRRALARRKGLSCKACGREAGDSDPTTPGRKIRLFVDLAVPPKDWEGRSLDNVEALCVACKEGFDSVNFRRCRPSRLIVSIRRATVADQLAALNWLIRKYPDIARKQAR